MIAEKLMNYILLGRRLFEDLLVNKLLHKIIKGNFKITVNL